MVKNADVREHYFSTPLAVSSASQAFKKPWSGRNRAQDGQHLYGQPPVEKRKGKGKSTPSSRTTKPPVLIFPLPSYSAYYSRTTTSPVLSFQLPSYSSY